MSQKESIPYLVFFLSWYLGVVTSGSFDLPLSLKIAVPSVMFLADAMVAGRTEPARNPIALYVILELFDASV